MENQQTQVENKLTWRITWKIKEFSKLESKLYSDKFFVGGHPWTILLFPKGNGVDNFLSLYLESVVLSGSGGPSSVAGLQFAAVNQVNCKQSQTSELKHVSERGEEDWGEKLFMPLDTLWDPNNGFIVNDTCIIVVLISFVDEAVSQVSAQLSIGDKPMEVHHYDPEVIDFMGFGKIEKAFTPFLEEVFVWYPWITDLQKRRTAWYVEGAFRMLGRVLYFLKSKKVKDMNDGACNYLQLIWKELNVCNLDLSWLEPHVQYALSMKSYMERMRLARKTHVAELEMGVKEKKDAVAELDMRVEKMIKDYHLAVAATEAKLYRSKSNDMVNCLKQELVERLKAELAALEGELGMAKSDLEKVEQVFDRELDAKLGYGAGSSTTLTVKKIIC